MLTYDMFMKLTIFFKTNVVRSVTLFYILKIFFNFDLIEDS